MRTVVLVRHGPSAHVHAEGALDRAGIARWRTRYDEAGIVAGARAPDALVAMVARAERLLASDMPRAMESARRLAPEREIEATALLREVSLEVPAWPTRLPLALWGLVVYAGWRWDELRGVDPYAAEGARLAATSDLLERTVADGQTCVAVTHGAFRRMLAAHLVARGWRCAERRGGFGHWSAWTFRRDDGRPAPIGPASQ